MHTAALYGLSIIYRLQTTHLAITQAPLCVGPVIVLGKKLCCVACSCVHIIMLYI